MGWCGLLLRGHRAPLLEQVFPGTGEPAGLWLVGWYAEGTSGILGKHVHSGARALLSMGPYRHHC